MRVIVISTLLCSATIVAPSATGQDKAPSPKIDLGFDASKVPLPDPKKGKPVARVLDQYIYPDQPPFQSPVSDKDKTYWLQSYILCPLFDRFKEREKIEPTREELAQLEAFQRKAGSDTVGLTHVFFYRRLSGKHDPGQDRIDAIALWKIERILYDRYGGVVGRNKFRGPMPVDAYHHFLKDAERTGAFQIFDKQRREGFFDSWKQRPRFVVPPDEVSFDKPWWVTEVTDKLK
jgi:hypothetical protein